jgi:hypothetical protein
MNEASEKHRAHELIERLPDSQIATAVRFLEFMLLDPVRRALATAPSDDEPVTEQDRQRFHCFIGILVPSPAPSDKRAKDVNIV